MDLRAAISTSKLTGKAEALTIREFGDRVAPKVKTAPSVRRSA